MKKGAQVGGTCVGTGLKKYMTLKANHHQPSETSARQSRNKKSKHNYETKIHNIRLGRDYEVLNIDATCVWEIEQELINKGKLEAIAVPTPKKSDAKASKEAMMLTDVKPDPDQDPIDSEPEDDDNKHVDL